MLNNLMDTSSLSDYSTWIIIIVLVVVMVVMFVISNRRQKKAEAEQKAIFDAVKPGNKVKTVGGICGVVVEVNEEDNTFILETGSEASGRSYLKFDKQAIYTTDAKPEAEEKKGKKEEEILPVGEEKAAEVENKEETEEEKK